MAIRNKNPSPQRRVFYFYGYLYIMNRILLEEIKRIHEITYGKKGY
jgi:hypothetical protein